MAKGFPAQIGGITDTPCFIIFPVDVKLYRDRVKTPRGLLRAMEMFLMEVVRREGINISGKRRKKQTLSVIITGDERMAWLNETFTGRKGPTDVLAFPDDKQPEIYLSWDEAVRRGEPCSESVRLALHGLLHLLGHDHHNRKQRAEMIAAEEAYLSCWIFLGSPR